MIRLFNVYYPIRTLILLGGEALLVWMSFLVATVWQHPENSYIVLNYEHGYYKILAATVLVLVFSHLFDLYEPAQWAAKGELYFSVAAGAGYSGAGSGGAGFNLSGSADREQCSRPGFVAGNCLPVRLANDVRLAGAATLFARASLRIRRGRACAKAG